MTSGTDGDMTSMADSALLFTWRWRDPERSVSSGLSVQLVGTRTPGHGPDLDPLPPPPPPASASSGDVGPWP